MKTFVQPGISVEFTAPSGGVVSGTGVLIGALLVIPQASAAVGERFNGITQGIVSHAKAASQAWTEGAKVYWDATNKVFTTTSSGNTLAGVAVEAVGSGVGETTGKVFLVPMAA